MGKMADNFCEGPNFVATLRRLENLLMRSAKVSLGSKNSSSLGCIIKGSACQSCLMHDCSDNIHTFQRIRSLGSTVDLVVSMPLM